MHAVKVTEFGGADVLRVVDVDIPIPGPSQVRIRTVATSVNFADIKAREGRYHGGSQPPFTPGIDVAGIVDLAGSNVTNFTAGARVIAFPTGGSYADFVLAEESLTYPLPDELDWDTAAAMPTVAVTAYELLTRVTRVQAGEAVLVHAAAGGIGAVAVQLSRHLGAGVVVGIVGKDEKAVLVRECGADMVVNWRSYPFAEVVLEATGGRGADVILDSVGGDQFAQNLQCLAPFGRLGVFGNTAGSYGTVDGGNLHSSCRSVLGYSMDTARRLRPESLRTPMTRVLQLAAEGSLRLPIFARYPLAQAADAHRALESGLTTGKLLLTLA